MAGRAQHWRLIRQAALLLVVLAIAHEAIYLLRFGSAGALPMDVGHAYWPALLLVAGAGVALLVARGWWRLTRGIAAASASETELPAGYGGEWRRIIGSLAPSAAALYLVVENLEHLIGHGHAEGLAIYLAPESILSLPIVLAAAAFAAAIGALVRWREIVLIERRHRAAHRHSVPAAERASSRWLVTAALVRRLHLTATSDTGRAPPISLPA